MIAGELAPASGAVNYQKSTGDEQLRIGLLTQETYIPDPHGNGDNRTALEAFVEVVGSELAAQELDG